MDGIVQAWHHTFGFIYTKTQRYFFHISEFNSERVPRCGEQVLFETKEAARAAHHNGNLPLASNVRPLELAKQEVL